ncbi:MAG: efflux RND transporter periplasmic adaptor subunit, partial [Polyangiaceae bacterium]|nr:efflux RND transporter periplasmic adaptor subunit [Polyangiaceae bacterium]
MRSLIVLALAVLVAAAAGCQRSSEDTAPIAKVEKPVAATQENAMCAEHGVLEAVCTKCNPKLIPVFQAKGDWCPEHGFPKSICPICHPERAGKPEIDVTTDGAPADGTRIRLQGKGTPTTVGIETVAAALRPSGAAISAPVRIVYDATKLALINARSPGVVSQLQVDLGSQVKKGDALLSIDSAGVGADRARLSAAQAGVRVEEENLQRESQLEREGVSSRAKRLQAQQALDSAKAEADALSASLSVIGAQGPGKGGYTLRAPLSGTVTQVQVNIGRFVGTEDILLEIVDTSGVWAELDVAESDLSAVRVGHVVSFAFDSLGTADLGGTISYVSPGVDPHTRTVKARVPLPNANGALRANLYGQARIAGEGGKTAVSVPRAAVQRAKGVALVFVRLNANEYETRRVQLGASTETSYEILKGVQAGEHVVTTGGFLLK